MILVAGASGSLGSRIVRGLLARGDRVRVLLRPGKPANTLDGADVTIGDLRDRDSLARACRGVHAVVTTASVSKTGDDTVENVDLQGNENLVAAAQDAGVEHFVFTSTLSASEQSPVPLFRIKASIERTLRETDQICDAPTIELLDDVVRRTRRHLAWGQEVLDRLCDTDAKRERRRERAADLRERLAACGGVTGEGS